MSDVILLEFNEVNQRVLCDMVAAGQLPHFKRLIDHGQLATTTVDEPYENLEPWIQWVTAHTGKSQLEHKAFNLSDGQHSQIRQLWDVLEAQGVPCGLVSPMNARRGQLVKGFFVPDPWSVSDDTYPSILDPIYRFIAERVQQHNITLERGSSKLDFLRACLRAGVPADALIRLGTAYFASRIDPKTKWRLAAALDRFLWDIADALRLKFKTRFTSVFMNAVAHYQHHYWTEHQGGSWRAQYPLLFSKRNPVSERNLRSGDDPIAHGLKCYDAIVGSAIASSGIGSVVVLTGLSQVPFEGYADESGFYLYRPIDHQRLFATLSLSCSRVAPLMSRDCMLYFATESARRSATRTLASVMVNGRAVFQFAQESDLRIFVKVIYSYDARPEDLITADSLPQPLSWGDYFSLITFKTGHHSSEGTVIAQKGCFKDLCRSDGKLELAKFPTIIVRMLDLNTSDNVARSFATSQAFGS